MNQKNQIDGVVLLRAKREISDFKKKLAQGQSFKDPTQYFFTLQRSVSQFDKNMASNLRNLTAKSIISSPQNYQKLLANNNQNL